MEDFRKVLEEARMHAGRDNGLLCIFGTFGQAKQGGIIFLSDLPLSNNLSANIKDQGRRFSKFEYLVLEIWKSMCKARSINR